MTHSLMRDSEFRTAYWHTTVSIAVSVERLCVVGYAGVQFRIDLFQYCKN